VYKRQAKIYTTSTSIGSSYTEENLNTDYVENEYGEINRDVWKIYNSLDGNRPFDAGMYEVAQYLEDNKEALNGLVVGSVENTVFDEDKFDIYNTLSEFESESSKKIVLLELMALIYSDDFLHEGERVVLEKILEEFDLSYDLSIVYTEWAKAMLSLFKQGNALINI
jgi:hypothetical protein